MKKHLYNILMPVFMSLITIGLCLLISSLTGYDFWNTLTMFTVSFIMEIKWRLLNDK